MKKTFTLFLLLSQIYSYAQQIKFSSDEVDGIQSDLTNTHNYYLPLSNNEVLYAGGKADGSDIILNKINKEGKIVWSNSKFDNFLCAGKVKNNILVFSATDKSRSGYIRSISVSLLNPENGQSTLEKEIAVFSDKTFTDFYVLTDSNQNFKYLILRSTEQEKSRSFNFKYQQSGGYTDNLQAISLNEKLEIKTITLNAANIQKAQFISCICNNDGDIFIAFAQGDNLSVSRFNVNTPDASATINAKLNFENNIAIYTHGFIKMHQNSIALNCRLEEEKKDGYTSVTGIFNFDINKGFVQEVVMDKDYLKQTTGQKNLTEVYPVGIEFYNDKLVVMQEGWAEKSTTDMKSVYFTFNPLIITFYNDNMKQLKELRGSENTNFYVSLPTSDYKILNNKLYLFYNQNEGGLRGVQIKYQTINLDSLSINKDSDFDIDRKLNSMLFGYGIIWFNNTALLPVIRKTSGFSVNKYSTTFKGIDFNDLQ